MAWSITQCLPPSREQGAAHSRTLLARGAQASLRSSSLASQGWGISRRNKSQVLLKKGHFLQQRPAWRGERAQCCNHGEGRALTQPSPAGSSSGWPRSSRSTRPLLLLLWHQQQQGTCRDTQGHGLAQARLEVSGGLGCGQCHQGCCGHGRWQGTVLAMHAMPPWTRGCGSGWWIPNVGRTRIQPFVIPDPSESMWVLNPLE